MARARRRLVDGRGRPLVADSFNRYIVANGGIPLLRKDNDKLLFGYFDAALTLTDNAAVDTDLTVQSVWDERVQQLYGSSSGSDVKATMRIAAVQLLIYDASFRSESLALKESLQNAAYVQMQRGDKVMTLPLRGHIWEPWVDTQVTQTAAADGDFALLKGEPRKLDGGGINLDMFQDEFTFNIDSAINWASGNILAYLRVYGAMAPDGYPGALSGDGGSDACALALDDDDNISIGPVQHSEMLLAGYGSLGALGFNPASLLSR